MRDYAYNVSNFVHEDHRKVSGLVSNLPDVLGLLAGQDFNHYFPPLLALACVTDMNMVLMAKNFMALVIHVAHNNGTPQTSSNWYTATFPTIPKGESRLE
jgi:hypothetical protein